jgi:hypothetical protein
MTSGHMVNRQISINMFDRFIRVVSSNVNKVIKDLEDPEKVLDQAVNDMQSDLIKIRQSYAEISATQKRMQSQKQNADTLVNVIIIITILFLKLVHNNTCKFYLDILFLYIYMHVLGLVPSRTTCSSSW